MKPISPIIAKYTIVLLAAFLFWWWLMFRSGINIPDKIPQTPIMTYGLGIIVISIAGLIFAERYILKTRPTITVRDLTLMAFLTCFLSETSFHILLSFMLKDADKLSLTTALLIIVIYDLVISFCIAYQLKTKRTGRLISFIVVFIVLINIIVRLFPRFFGMEDR